MRTWNSKSIASVTLSFLLTTFILAHFEEPTRQSPFNRRAVYQQRPSHWCYCLLADRYGRSSTVRLQFSYLFLGECGANGEQCTLVETTLRNPTSPGSGSSSDISLIPPYATSCYLHCADGVLTMKLSHKFNVAAGFKYVFIGIQKITC